MSGYLLGSFLPLPWVSTHARQVQLAIQFGSVLATLVAVVVALFRDELRQVFLRPVIGIHLDQELLTEVLTESSQSADFDSITSPRAERYDCILQITNTGNASAKDCVLYIEKIVERNAQDVPYDRRIAAQPLPWVGTAEKGVVISETATNQACVATLLEPKEARGPSDSAKTASGGAPGFRVGNLEVGPATVRVEVTLALHSDNSRPVRRVLEIRWNRQWHPRLSELKKTFQAKIVES